jgi:NitT/TauT family transport system substrate-binding protein
MFARAIHGLSRFVPYATVLAICSFALLLLAGCKGGDAGGSGKVKVCYLGLTCENPIFSAYELGFFQEEGVDVELVKSDWGSMRDGLGLGNFHATHHLIMYLLKPIENGLDVKLTGGIHTGCLRLQAGARTEIKKVEDLKGKKVAISHMGSPPFLFASRVLTAHHMDAQRDVEWIVMQPATFELALDRGDVEAVASAEPIGTILVGSGKAKRLVDQAEDSPYEDEFCCVTAVNGKFAANNPEAAAKVTRALMKGAKWTSENKMAAAKMAVEKGYLASTVELNAQAVRPLKYIPAVAKARADILHVAKEMKEANLLEANTDPEELIKRAWLDLPGVTDEWIKTIKVEKIAGGGDPAKLGIKELAALICSGKSCCAMGCCGELDYVLPMTEAWASVRPRRYDPDQPQRGDTRFVRNTR